jgi:hypothetical protein
LGRFMAEKIAAAGLPKRCVTHGLRKAAARCLAESGCSANEIAAITGHATLVEVSRYTKAAEQKRLARAAIERLTARESVRIPKPGLRVWEGKVMQFQREKVRVWFPKGCRLSAAPNQRSDRARRAGRSPVVPSFLWP